jgi:predicted nucleotidyltransferase
MNLIEKSSETKASCLVPTLFPLVSQSLRHPLSIHPLCQDIKSSTRSICIYALHLLLLTMYSILSTIVLKKEYNTMLDSLYISKSKIRRDLLTLFFTNPNQKYYLRELQHTLGYSAGSIRRELIKFQKDNLFNTQKVGNLLYYSLNTKHPLFKELKTIVSKTVGVEARLKNALSSIKDINVAFIYGSFASNRANATSDIDLMIIGDPNTSQLNEKIAQLERNLRREVNPTIYSLDEYKARKKSKSGFIMDLLKNPKIMLVGKESDL